MKIRYAAGCIAALVVAAAQTASPQASATPEQVSNPQAERALLNQYCVTCHNQKLKTAGLELDQLDPAHVAEHPEKWELVVRKLRAGMMPPSGMPRPAWNTYESMVAWLEGELDKTGATHLPPPGLHRLNRTEYANVIHDLLALDVDPTKYLPSDDSTRGFDNIAGALSLSPALLEGYTTAAAKISRIALGDVNDPSLSTYRVPSDTSQDYHIEGMPFGTRGGLAVQHEFPADGDYVFKIFPINKGLMDGNRAFGEITGEKLELLIDGERIHLYDWDKEVASGKPVHGGTADIHFQVKAGLHTVGVTFLATQLAPSQDLDEHFLRDTIETGGLPGFKFYPHVGKMEILGPFKPAGASDSPSAKKIFVCHPAEVSDEAACAKKVIDTLARHAFRRPITAEDTETLMSFYQQGRNEGNFNTGIERALQRILADPEFVFRKEAEPEKMAAGQTYHISDLELASRLSFFLWSSIPDDELIDVAARNKLHEPAVLDAQVRRMLADPRADRLVINFTGQWLNLRALATWSPTISLFPDFDDNLRLAMRKETELFVGSVVHEDRSLIDLLDGNYTFLNERLAKHYGFPGVYGSDFRRVDWTPDFDMRRGLLGKAAIETISSYPQRTTPTVRGKDMMQIFLGVSPPDPPPNVPQLKDQGAAVHGGLKPTMRQQMEMHRKVAPCSTCHKIMDPIGFSMENFDAVGTWRTTDNGSPIDATGMLVDGTKLDGVKGMREALLRYSPQFVRVVTEKLFIYAMGRGSEYYDMPLIRSIVRDAEAKNYRFSSIILGIVKSEPFLANQKQEVTSNEKVPLRASVK
jgi:mono/diheme cytochrome c family protein